MESADLQAGISSDVKHMTAAASTLVREGDEDKSLTCMVCGKFFPRGGVDLERHCSAPTLLHYCATKAMPQFQIQCSCGLCFANNSQMQLHKLRICVNTGPHAKIMPVPVVVSREIKAARLKKKEKTKDGKKETKASISKNSSSKAQTKSAEGVPMAPAGGGDTTSAQGRGVKRDLEYDGSVVVGKRMKVIIPEDRKAFFAVVSLLVDPKMMPAESSITTSNFDEFIPARHHSLVKRLKERLNWSA